MSVNSRVLEKLRERMDAPLPVYQNSQINKIKVISRPPGASDIFSGLKVTENQTIEDSEKQLEDFIIDDSIRNIRDRVKNPLDQKIESNIKSEDLPVSETEKTSFDHESPLKAITSKTESLGKRVKLSNDQVEISNSCSEAFPKKITDYFGGVLYEIKEESNESSNLIEKDNSISEHKESKEEEHPATILLKDREQEIALLMERLVTVEDKFKQYKLKSSQILSYNLVELERLKRFEQKTLIQSQKDRIGYFLSVHEGSKMKDVWLDGYELNSLKRELSIVLKKREELEKQKKRLKKKIKSTESATKTEDKAPKSLALTHLSSLKLISGAVHTSSDSIDESSNHHPSIPNSEYEDSKLRIQSQILYLSKEEYHLKTKIEFLEKEKENYLSLSKKIHEEENSRFGKLISQDLNSRWPILGDRYQLLSLLGKGGFSEVYRAFDLHNLKEVAIKVHQLNPNWNELQKSNYIKHALRESEVHKDLSHPNIVEHLDSVEIDSNSFCTVLELCLGTDLSTLIKRHRYLSERESRSIIRQVLDALLFLNDNNKKIIHYDLKPQNILFSEGVVKITDFGLCKIMTEEETKLELTSQGVGTYWYLPPECFARDPPGISSKVDVWSVGVILYEMLFGVKPFGNSMSQERIWKEGIILKATQLEFPNKPTVSPEIKDFIKGCLEHNQELRFSVEQAWNFLYKS